MESSVSGFDFHPPDKRIEIMNIEEIEIGTKWEDTLGICKFDEIGKFLKGGLKREVIITGKTSNTLEYKDSGGYISWIMFDDFVRVERSTKKERFVLIG